MKPPAALAALLALAVVPCARSAGSPVHADRAAPRVELQEGTIARGRPPTFYYAAGDDSGWLRAEFTLRSGRAVVARGHLPFTDFRRAAKGYFALRGPLPEVAAGSVYRACVQVWDRADNTARSCADYRLVVR